jgi:hypothetical protein
MKIEHFWKRNLTLFLWRKAHLHFYFVYKKHWMNVKVQKFHSLKFSNSSSIQQPMRDERRREEEI